MQKNIPWIFSTFRFMAESVEAGHGHPITITTNQETQDIVLPTDLVVAHQLIAVQQSNMEVQQDISPSYTHVLCKFSDIISSILAYILLIHIVAVRARYRPQICWFVPVLFDSMLPCMVLMSQHFFLLIATDESNIWCCKNKTGNFRLN